MSIIGTRPPLISETNFYELHHRARLAIKPGITGMWQVSGRSDITDFEEVVRLDKEYITDWNIGLPTPYDKFSKKVDACYVVEAVKDVMKVCHKGATVVIESTVSPGTIDKFVRPVIEENGFTIGQDINLVHAPERIIPGNMV